MNKIKLNMWVNIIAFLALIPIIVSSIVLFFKLASGINPFLGMNKALWVKIHNYFGWTFIGLILIHILLHIGWIKCIPSMMKSK